MSDHQEGTEGKAIPERQPERSEAVNVVLRGHIGGLTDDVVVIVPRLYDSYAIEVWRKDVVRFEARPSGRCRFVVRGDARVHERLAYTTRRAAMVSSIADAGPPPPSRYLRSSPMSRTRSANSWREAISSFL